MHPFSISHSYGIPAHPDCWIRTEAAMDEINATQDQQHVQQHVQEQITAAVAAYRAMLDTFVNQPERPIAPEAELARLRPS
jgi:hypothetical protein